MNEERESPDNFLKLYGDNLFGYAMVRVKDAAIAEDLVQETLLKAFKAYDKFRGDSAVKTWLVSILRNEIANYFRKAQNRFQKTASDLETDDLSTLLHPEVSNSRFNNAIERDEFWSMIQSCFERVPDHLLHVFLAKFGEEKRTTEEICSEMGISASNFSVRMFRTRLLLRKCVEDNWIEGD